MSIDSDVAAVRERAARLLLISAHLSILAACKVQPSATSTQSTEVLKPVVSETSVVKPNTTPTPTNVPSVTRVPKTIPTSVPTSTPTPTPPWGNFPGPKEDSEIEIPPPIAPIHFPEDVVNILFLGTDRRPTWKYYQTDAMVILSLDPDAGRATFISIPRDLYVYIPGWKVNRINTAEYHGGFEMVADTILYNLGIPIHHYVKMEYWGFSEAIDIVDGIDVRSTGDVDDMCERVPYMYEKDVVYHMDGFDAMCYIRMRMKSSDFDRLRRQQDVFLALVDKFMSIDGMLKIPQLYETFSEIVETDLGLGELLPLIPLGTQLALDNSRIQFVRIDYSMVDDWRTPENNYWVLLPKRDLIRTSLESIFTE